MRLVRALLALLCLAAAQPDRGILIRGAHVFDGSGAPASPGDVLISGPEYRRGGPAPACAAGSQDRGWTRLDAAAGPPRSPRAPALPRLGGPDDLGKAYAAHLLHGVTSVNDFSMSGEMLAPVREMIGSGAVAAPNLRLAIRIGVPGGHGTERGWGDFFTMEAPTPAAAKLVMDRALPYRPDVIKVVCRRVALRQGAGPQQHEPADPARGRGARPCGGGSRSSRTR
jgi:hypothetical protein